MVKLKRPHCGAITYSVFYLINFFIFILLILPVLNIKITFWWLDNLLNLQIQWSLIALLLIIINFIYIKKFRVFFSFVYVTTILYNLMPLYFPVTGQVEKRQLTLNKSLGQKVISLNIAQLNLNYNNPDLEKLLPTLGDKRFDLLVLEEAADTEYKNIKKLEQYYPYSFGMGALEATPSGMAIFSRWPIIEKQVHELGYKSGQLIEVIIQIPKTDSPIQLFSLHPASPRTKTLWKLRNQTLIAAAEHIINSPFTNKIIIGDFNNTPWTYSFKHFQQQTQLKNSADGFGYIPSWSYSAKPLLSLISSVYIDHNLVSKNFIILSKNHQSIEGSDHLLLLTKLAIWIKNIDVDLQNAKKSKEKIEKTAL